MWPRSVRCLGYLFVTGRTPVALSAAVPPVTGWHDTGAAPPLSPDTTRSLLDSCDPVDPGRDPELLAIADDRLEPVIGAVVTR